MGAVRGWRRGTERPSISLRSPTFAFAVVSGMIQAGLHALLLLLAFALPFEVIHPVVALPGVRFTNLELVATAAIAVWVAHLGLRSLGSVRAGKPWRDVVRGWVEQGRRPTVWVPLAFLGLTLASALLAPAYRLEALKFATRVATGVLAFWMLADAVRSSSRAVALLGAIVAGAGVSAVFAFGEAFGWAPVTSLLPWFKDGPARVGGTIRVGGSFQYATMAAMYFETASMFAVAVAATASTSVRRGLALSVGAAGAAIVVLTFSRAGMTTLALVLVLAAAIAWRRAPLRAMVPPAVVTLGALVATAAFFAWDEESFRTRLVTENDLGWYGASYTAPDSLEVPADQTTEVRVGVRNTGAAHWGVSGTNPFALGYYWLSDDRPVGGGHVEVPLPRLVQAGDSVSVTVRLTPRLPPGDYRLVWGMLQHRILWFRHRGVTEASTRVRVTGNPDTVDLPLVAGDTLPGGAMPSLPPTVGRMDLWRAAGEMWADRPLLGVGPDNFRHLYGGYLGLSRWDDRMHSNSLYLELLAGWGLAGTFAFLSVALLVGRAWLRLWRSAVGAEAVRALALGCGFLAFFIHGLLDYFLAFTPHYLLFWTVAGLIVAMSRYNATISSRERSSV